MISMAIQNVTKCVMKNSSRTTKIVLAQTAHINQQLRSGKFLAELCLHTIWPSERSSGCLWCVTKNSLCAIKFVRAQIAHVNQRFKCAWHVRQLMTHRIYASENAFCHPSHDRMRQTEMREPSPRWLVTGDQLLFWQLLDPVACLGTNRTLANERSIYIFRFPVRTDRTECTAPTPVADLRQQPWS